MPARDGGNRTALRRTWLRNARGRAEFRDTESHAAPPGSHAPASLDDILQGAGSIAAQQHVMAKLIEMTSSPAATAAGLEDVILTDPAIAARVLALANSAYFSLPRQVLYVREAVVFLGFKTVRSLALAVNAQQLFRDAPRRLRNERARLWRHSLEVALASRKIAEILHQTDRADVGAEEAFTSGLLHDVGKLVLEVWSVDRALIASRLIQERGARFTDMEIMLFPHGHAEVGGALAERWRLPSIIGEAITCHHAPETAVIAPQLVAVVTLANELTHASEKCRLKDAEALKQEPPPAQLAAALTRLGVPPGELPSIADACRMEAEHSHTLHGLL